MNRRDTASVPGPLLTSIDRRAALRLAALGTGALALAPLAPAMAARPLRVLVATNEPWGTYHIKPLLDEAAAARPDGR